MKPRSVFALHVIAVAALLLTLTLACAPGSQPEPTAAPGAGAPADQPKDEGSLAEVSPTAVPPTEAAPTPIPPTEPPPTAVPPTAVPPTAEPPTALPPTSTPEAAPLFDNQYDPVSLLASFVNAINRGEYGRAWGYWETPPSASLEDFTAGYADTISVLLAVHPPTWYEGAAGSNYAQIPALMLATHTDAGQYSFVGCYVARSSNVEGAAPGWWLYDATVGPAPGNSDDAALLVSACEGPSPSPEPAFDDRGGPVQVLASLFNAINLKDYARGWAYWESPPNPTFDDFKNGYADTDSVFLVVRPPVGYEGAAGSSYARVQALMLATHTDASQHGFLGCYVARAPNLGADAGVWSLYDASAQVLAAGNRGAHLLAGACEGP